MTDGAPLTPYSQFEKIFPYNNLTADLAIHLKPAAGGREPVHVIRRVRMPINIW